MATIFHFIKKYEFWLLLLRQTNVKNATGPFLKWRNFQMRRAFLDFRKMSMILKLAQGNELSIRQSRIAFLKCIVF